VAWAFLDPVQRICELTGAVETDVQWIGDADAGRNLGGGELLIAIDNVDLLTAGEPHAMTGRVASVGVHGLITNSSTSRSAAFSTLLAARRFA
jgi:hypothetical protein